MRVHHDGVTEERSLPVLEPIQALVREVAMSETQFFRNKRATRERNQIVSFALKSSLAVKFDEPRHSIM